MSQECLLLLLPLLCPCFLAAAAAAVLAGLRFEVHRSAADSVQRTSPSRSLPANLCSCSPAVAAAPPNALDPELSATVFAPKNSAIRAALKSLGFSSLHQLLEEEDTAIQVRASQPAAAPNMLVQHCMPQAGRGAGGFSTQIWQPPVQYSSRARVTLTSH